MQGLIDRFENAAANIGNTLLKHPIFYNSPIGIRFEIGSQDEHMDILNKDLVYGDSYVEASLNRLISIYTHNSFVPQILRIDVIDNDYTDKAKIIDLCNSIGLNEYTERVVKYNIDGEKFKEHQLYWDIKNTNYDYKILLKEIIKSDLGGIGELSSNVFFMDDENNILLHPYDDRGADLVADNKEKIRVFYDDFNSWILNYDREIIDKLFDN